MGRKGVKNLPWRRDELRQRRLVRQAWRSVAQNSHEPLDDNVKSLCDAVSSFAELPADVQDLVDPDLRLVVLDQDSGRRT